MVLRGEFIMGIAKLRKARTSSCLQLIFASLLFFIGVAVAYGAAPMKSPAVPIAVTTIFAGNAAINSKPVGYSKRTEASGTITAD